MGVEGVVLKSFHTMPRESRGMVKEGGQNEAGTASGEKDA